MPEIEIPTSHHIDRSQFTRPKSTLRNALREATAADHARLDQRLGALELGAADGYRRFLEINATALLPLERALREAGVRQLLPDWDMRVRTGAILGDLAAVGGTLSRLDSVILGDNAAMLGTLYVLEGSRLGATYLVKRVMRSNNPVVSGNTRFLAHGVGKQFWASFLTVLEDHAGTIEADNLIPAARRAFDLFAESARSLS